MSTNDDLTYEQEYEVPVELTLNTFSVEYAGCGSHELRVKAVTSLKNVQALFNSLREIPGIES